MFLDSWIILNLVAFAIRENQIPCVMKIGDVFDKVTGVEGWDIEKYSDMLVPCIFSKFEILEDETNKKLSLYELGPVFVSKNKEVIIECMSQEIANWGDCVHLSSDKKTSLYFYHLFIEGNTTELKKNWDVCLCERGNMADKKMNSEIMKSLNRVIFDIWENKVEDISTVKTCYQEKEGCVKEEQCDGSKFQVWGEGTSGNFVVDMDSVKSFTIKKWQDFKNAKDKGFSIIKWCENSIITSQSTTLTSQESTTKPLTSPSIPSITTTKDPTTIQEDVRTSISTNSIVSTSHSPANCTVAPFGYWLIKMNKDTTEKCKSVVRNEKHLVMSMFIVASAILNILALVFTKRMMNKTAWVFIVSGSTVTLIGFILEVVLFTQCKIEKFEKTVC